MARGDDKNARGFKGSATAVADKENRVSDMAIGESAEERPRRDFSPSAPTDQSAGPSRGFFDIYKPGQGYYTRIWSGVSYGVLVCWLAFFLYEKLELVGTGATTKYVQVGVAVGIIITLGLLGYWLLALNRRVCDFLIATEGEMKKVNWTSRKEIIGSTKVVVFVVVALSVILFVVDMFFIVFFHGIGILKGGGIFDAIRRVF
jgi:preprotein translocase SecE subunit